MEKGPIPNFMYGFLSVWCGSLQIILSRLETVNISVAEADVVGLLRRTRWNRNSSACGRKPELGSANWR